MGKLSTHVLDTSIGKPGQGVKVALFRLDELCPKGTRALILGAMTNADGRCDSPLLQGDSMRIGVYELDFHMGDYFATQGIELPEPKFIDVVTLRFGIADAAQNYHVPLVVTPWSYSTYRGS